MTREEINELVNSLVDKTMADAWDRAKQIYGVKSEGDIANMSIEDAVNFSYTASAAYTNQMLNDVLWLVLSSERRQL